MNIKLKTKCKSCTNKYNSEIAVLNLINRFFWKSKIGPISSMLLPLMFMAIYRIISIDNPSGINIFINGFPAYVSLSVLPICLVTLPQMIVELKSSIILRKISVSKVTSLRFCFITLVYFFIACNISTLIIITIYAIILNKDAFLSLSNIAWGEFIYVILNLVIISLSVGLFLGVVIRRSNISQIVGFAILLLSVSLAGQFIPISVIGGSKPIQIVSLFSPVTYSLNMLNNVLLVHSDNLIKELQNIQDLPSNITDILDAIKSFNPGESIFDVKHTFCIFSFSEDATQVQQLFIQIYQPWSKIMNLVMSIPFSIFFYVYSIKCFNWTNR